MGGTLLPHSHSCGWEVFAPCWEVWKAAAREDWSKKLLSTWAFSSILLLVLQLCSWGGCILFNLSVLDDTPVETLLILCVPCKLHLQPHIGLPDPIPTELGSMHILLPGHMLPLPVCLLLVPKCYSKQVTETLVTSPQGKTVKSLTIPLAFIDL